MDQSKPDYGPVPVLAFGATMQRTMKRFAPSLLALTLLVNPAWAGLELRSLVTQLIHDGDARVRMKAALDLGKTRNRRVRVPLEKALRDPSPQVRAAAAAALRVLGDPRAIPALERLSEDPEVAVRSQVQAALGALRERAAHASQPAKYWVKMGAITTSLEGVEHLLASLKAESRKQLEAISGIHVIEEVDVPPTAEGEASAPVVLVTGHLRSTEETRDASGVRYAVKVEFVVHSYPSRAIVGLVSGSASSRAGHEELKTPKQITRFRRDVLAAAVESALRRAPDALAIAAR